ncbi:transmembrane domain-containing protein [Streptomyces sp. NPDC096040]|uniref:EGFR-like transmembrane domain-containing protein n=1 Tax=Streptomyces sp. NPDC096040 TaxID=3155541 RepID=UPI00331CF863
MNDWMRARNGWTILLMFWGVTLTAGLLGEAMSRMVFEHHPTPSVTSNLPWVVGGSLFMALGGTVGVLRRRRRQG